MSERTIEGRWGRRWLLPALLGLVLVIAAVVGGGSLSRPSPPPTIPTPISIQSVPWRVDAEATLTLHTSPPRAGESISLTILAPGTGQSQSEARESFPPEIGGACAELVEGERGGAAFFGLSGVQLLWLPPEHREIEIALAAAAGVKIIGLDFDWRHIEPQPGQYDWVETDDVVALAKRYGLRLAPMLLYTPRWASSVPFAPLDYHRASPSDYDDYRDFVYTVVNRYKPHGASRLTKDGYGITDWVIWNEPNVRASQEAPEPGRFWNGSLEEYLLLLRAGYEGAHAADPGCNVLNGGLADVFWAEGKLDLITALERLYDPDGDGDTADGGRPFFDALNVHTYQAGAPDAAWYEERLEAILRVMERFGDREKPIWITETGYGSVTEPVEGSPYVDEPTQAEAVRLIYTACAAYPQVERVFWWSLRDYYSDGSAANAAMEAHYGLLRANFAPKPAYLAYARLTGSLDRALVLSAVTDGEGTAQVTVPVSFIAQPGDYLVFASLDEATLTAVVTYEASFSEGGRD